MIVPAVLIALVAWLLIPVSTLRPGLAQSQLDNTSLKLQLVRFMGAAKAHEDLIEMALETPTRNFAGWRQSS